jgi:hypothetical protein
VALDADGLERLCQQFVDAVRRADRVGFDAIEVHSAHGYLLHQFLSPISNQRTDDFGGSLENRMRFPLRVFAQMRAAWPAHKPMGLRFSATDWIDGGWDVELHGLCPRPRKTGLRLARRLQRGHQPAPEKSRWGPVTRCRSQPDPSRLSGIPVMAVKRLPIQQAEDILIKEKPTWSRWPGLAKTRALALAGGCRAGGQRRGARVSTGARSPATQRALFRTNHLRGTMTMATPVLTIAPGLNDRLEGSDLGVQFTFGVTRAGDSTVPVSVGFRVTSTQASANDFLDKDLQVALDYPVGTLTMAAGETSKTISVVVSSDRFFEPDERFDITLFNPVDAILGTQTTSSGIIRNDDPGDVLPVYRFAKLSNGAYFFTGSLGERNQIIASFPDFRAEGVGFFAYAEASAVRRCIASRT